MSERSFLEEVSEYVESGQYERDFEEQRAQNLMGDFDGEDDDNDWATIYSDDDEEQGSEEDDVIVEPVVPIDCHEITGKPVFCMPADVTIDPCAICFENIDQMINVVVNRCGHAFHASCMFEALDHGPGCPMCRCQLVPDIIEEDSDFEYDEDDNADDDEDQDGDEAEEQDGEAEEPIAHLAEPDESANEQEKQQYWLAYHQRFLAHYQKMLTHKVDMMMHYQRRNSNEDVLRFQTVEIPATIEDIKRHGEEIKKCEQLLTAALVEP